MSQTEPLTNEMSLSEHPSAEVIGNDLSPIQPEWYTGHSFS